MDLGDSTRQSHKEKSEASKLAISAEVVRSLPRSFGRKSGDDYCDVCCIELTSKVQFDQHMSGKTHAKRVKALQRIKTLSELGVRRELSTNEKSSDDPVGDAVKNNAEGTLPLKKSILEIPCEICGMIFNHERMARDHFESNKHLKKLAQVSEFKLGVDVVDEHPAVFTVGKPKGGLKDPTKTSFYCQFCDKQLNSEQQFNQHREGTPHKNNVEAQRSKPSPAPRTPGRFPCENCRMFFRTATLLRKHLMSYEHKTIVRYQKFVYGGQINGTMSSGPQGSGNAKQGDRSYGLEGGSEGRGSSNDSSRNYGPGSQRKGYPKGGRWYDCGFLGSHNRSHPYNSGWNIGPGPSSQVGGGEGSYSQNQHSDSASGGQQQDFWNTKPSVGDNQNYKKEQSSQFNYGGYDYEHESLDQSQQYVDSQAKKYFDYKFD